MTDPATAQFRRTRSIGLPRNRRPIRTSRTAWWLRCIYQAPALEAGPPSWSEQIAGGWEINGIVTFNSAGPFTITSGRDNSATAVNNDRPNVVGDWRICPTAARRTSRSSSTSTRLPSRRTPPARSATQAATSCADRSAATSISAPSRTSRLRSATGCSSARSSSTS